MLNAQNRKLRLQKMVIGALLTAIVIILQLAGSFIRLGTFSVSLVLLPVVIGAVLCGCGIGAWLGLVFGIVVIMSGDASLFMALHAPGTVITVLAKGILCGLASGAVYKLLQRYNRNVAVIAAAIVCPVVNTAVFLLGCFTFFIAPISEWAAAEGISITKYLITFMVGGNFLFELATNAILSPVIIRVIDFAKSKLSR